MKPKYQPLKAPKSKRDIAEQLRWLAEHIKDIGTSMKMELTVPYPGGFPFHFHGSQLIGIANTCLEWAEDIEKESK